MTNNKKNRTLAILFGLLPGAGHMYLGLFKQGLELMAIFFLGLFLTDSLQISLFMLVVPLVWFYSFFDVINKSSSEEPLSDSNLAIFSFFNDSESWNRKGNKIIGIALVVIGVLCLIEKIIFPMIDRYLSWEIRNYIQTGIIAALFILGGIKLLLGNKTKLPSSSQGGE